MPYYTLLRCKIFGLKIRKCKVFDKYHVWWARVDLLKLYPNICSYKVFWSYLFSSSQPSEIQLAAPVTGMDKVWWNTSWDQMKSKLDERKWFPVSTLVQLVWRYFASAWTTETTARNRWGLFISIWICICDLCSRPGSTSPHWARCLQ